MARLVAGVILVCSFLAACEKHYGISGKPEGSKEELKKYSKEVQDAARVTADPCYGRIDRIEIWDKKSKQKLVAILGVVIQPIEEAKYKILETNTAVELLRNGQAVATKPFVTICP